MTSEATRTTRSAGRVVGGMQGWAWALLALTLVLGACGGNNRRRTLRIQNTTGTVSGARAPIVRGNWMVYFVSEALTGAAGQDLNGDGDTTDEVAEAVRLDRFDQTLLGVAALDAEILNGQVFLHVDEALDGTDWNMNATTEHVLLHWNTRDDVVTFVDVLDVSGPNRALQEVDGKLLYVSAATPTGDETTLRRVFAGDPLNPEIVENTMGAGVLHPYLLTELEELVLFFVDETIEGGDRNGDGDATDGFVVVALDGEDNDARVVNLELAVRAADAPFGVRREGLNDWGLGLLVDEAAQGGVNLNDPALFVNALVPDSCAGTPDADTADQVLHYLRYADFVSGAAGPLNTGLAGTDRVLVVDDYVATLSLETEANCDLNEDGDTADTIARWTGVVAPVAPPRDASRLHAIETGIPGGALGLGSIGNRFVVIVDEAQDGRDHDGDGFQDLDLIAWVEPRDADPQFSFAHQGDGPSRGTGVFEDVDGDGLGDPDDGASAPYASAGWMSADTDSGRLLISFREAVPGRNPRVPSLNVNEDCAFLQKDTDLVDELPVWLDFEKRVLDFDGMGFAVDAGNPGLEIAGFRAFFRVSEAEDSFDHNQDGDLADFVLLTNPLTACRPRVLTAANALPGPVIHTDGFGGAAVIVDEAMDGEDYNEDGDTNDLVVRTFTY